MKVKHLTEGVSEKLLIVFLPFVLTMVGTVAFYCGIRWLVEIKFNLLNLKDELWNLWFPGIFAWASVMTFMRRRLHVLDFPKEKETRFYYQIVMVLAVVIPSVVSQMYLEKVAYELIIVRNVSEIENYENEKYFAVQYFDAKNDKSGAFVTSRTTGRNNDKLNFELFFVCPFEDTNAGIWYGIDYKKSISNGLGDDQKQSEYRSFISESELAFSNKNLKPVGYFERLRPSDDLDGYLKAVKRKVPIANLDEQIILIPQHESIEARSEGFLKWVFYWFGIGSAILLIMILFRKISKKGLKKYRENQPFEDDTFFFWEWLTELRKFPGTAFLSGIMSLVFIALVFAGMNVVNPSTSNLFSYGGLSGTAFYEGDYWRIITCIFLHSGVEHLFANLLSLVLAGIFFERTVGAVPFVLLFIFTAICGNFASIFWNEISIGVGASGGVFGLFGLMTAFHFFGEDESGGIYIAAIIGGISLICGFIFPGIDNAAHIGGLLSGFVVGCFYGFFRKNRS